MKHIIIAGILLAICTNVWSQVNPRKYSVTAEDIKRFETATPSKALVAPLKNRKVLIFQTFNGWRPPAVDYVDSAFALMGRKTKAFEVALITNDTGVFSTERLKSFDVVVLNNTNNMRLNNNQSEALQDFVKGGKGLFAFGSAISIQYWPEHAEMLGGFCFHHPFERSKINSNNEWAVQIDDPSYPLTKMFPEQFPEKETMYQIIGPYSRQDRRVLMSMDLSDVRTNTVKANTNICRKDGDFAVEWLRPYGSGRVFFSQMTHVNSELMFNPMYLQHFLDMMQYVAGDLKPDMTPVPVRNIVSGGLKHNNVEQNLALLQDKNVTNRVNAAAALGELASFNETAVAALIGALKDEASDVRYFAAKSLGKMAPKTVPDIAKLLVSTNPLEKSAALLALGFSGANATSLLKDVTDLLNDKNVTVKTEAVYALGRIAPNHSNTIPLLVKMLSDSLVAVREATVHILAEMGPAAKTALPQVTQSILKEKDNRTRRFASDIAVSLVKFPESAGAITAMASMLKGDWQLSMKAIVNFGLLGETASPAIPELIKLLKDERAETRAGAVMALGLTGKAAVNAIPAISELIQDKERLVRLNAAEALSKMGVKAEPMLTEMLTNNDWFIRLKALQGFILIAKENKGKFPKLKPLLSDNDHEVRRVALENRNIIE